MRSLNRVTLIGHLAAEVESRQTKSGKFLAIFPVATNHVYKDKDGKKQDKVDFHRIVAWNRRGEICEKYLAKGTAVYLEGRLINRSFENKKGETQYRTEIVASDINILTWKRDKNGKEEVGIEAIADENGQDLLEENIEITESEKELVAA